LKPERDLYEKVVWKRIPWKSIPWSYSSMEAVLTNRTECPAMHAALAEDSKFFKHTFAREEFAYRTYD